MSVMPCLIINALERLWKASHVLVAYMENGQTIREYYQRC